MKSIVVLILLGLCSTALAQMPHNWQKVMDFKEAYIASIKNGEILDSLNAVTLVKEMYEDSAGRTSYHEGLKRSTDRGRTWEWVWYKFKFEPVCLSYPSKNTIVVGGSNRFVGVSNDSGQSWRDFQFPKEPGENSYDAWSLSMFDDKHGLINITELQYYGDSFIYKTDDGWQTYSKVIPPKGYYYPNPLGDRSPYMQALTKTNYFVKLGIYFDTTRKQVFGKITDAGLTWKIITEDEIFYERSDTIQSVSFDFADSLNGWALGNMRYKGDNVPWCMLSKTTDGGLTWKKVNEYTMPYHKGKQYKGASYNGGISVTNDSEFIIAMPFASRTKQNKNDWKIDSVDLEYWYNRVFINARGKTDTYLAYFPGTKDILMADFGEYKPSGAIEEAREGIANLYPNPAQSLINIGLQGIGVGVSEVILFNNIGEKVMSKVISSGTKDLQLDISVLPNGIYSLLIKEGGKTTVKKIVITK